MTSFDASAAEVAAWIFCAFPIASSVHLTTSSSDAPQPRTAAAAAVVRALVDEGLLGEHEAAEAIDALANRGIVERAILHGAAAEAEDLLAHLEDDPPPA